MIWLYILAMAGTITAVAYICAHLERLRHWIYRTRGVTELTPRQRRSMARRYQETTGRKKPRRKR